MNKHEIVIIVIKSQRIRWLRHVFRMPTERTTRKAVELHPKKRTPQKRKGSKTLKMALQSWTCGGGRKQPLIESSGEKLLMKQWFTKYYDAKKKKKLDLGIISWILERANCILKSVSWILESVNYSLGKSVGFQNSQLDFRKRQ